MMGEFSYSLLLYEKYPFEAIVSSHVFRGLPHGFRWDGDKLPSKT